MSVGLVIAALCRRFAEFQRAEEPADGAVVAASLAALAVGIRIPARLALRLCLAAWRQLTNRGGSSEVSTLVLTQTSPDRRLQWAALSVIALACGVLTALLPLSAAAAERAYAWLHVHFVWSAAPLALLHAALPLLASLLPLSALGLAIAALHRLACGQERWSIAASGHILLGAAGGALLANSSFAHSMPSNALLIAGALPSLVVSLWAAAVGPLDPQATNAQSDPAPPPACSDAWPVLLRAAIITVGVAGIWAAAACTRNPRATASSTPTLVPLALAALGGGVLAGIRSRPTGPPSIGAFGFACALAGAMVAIGPLSVIHGAQHGGPTMMLLSTCGLAAIGHAAASGRRTLVARVAIPSSADAAIVGIVLVAGGAAVWFVDPAAMRAGGVLLATVILSLCLQGLGGLLIIREPGDLNRRRAQLCAIFACITGVIVVARAPQSNRPAAIQAARHPVEPSPAKESLPLGR